MSRQQCNVCGERTLGRSPTGDWCNTCGWAYPGLICDTCGRKGVNPDHLAPPDWHPCHVEPRDDNRYA